MSLLLDRDDDECRVWRHRGHALGDRGDVDPPDDAGDDVHRRLLRYLPPPVPRANRDALLWTWGEALSHKSLHEVDSYERAGNGASAQVHHTLSLPRLCRGGGHRGLHLPRDGVIHCRPVRRLRQHRRTSCEHHDTSAGAHYHSSREHASRSKGPLARGLGVVPDPELPVHRHALRWDLFHHDDDGSRSISILPPEERPCLRCGRLAVLLQYHHPNHHGLW
mmetsp:Transcript_11785/g.22719  ORF Transcript_11785/g.22719 Transcript_11785/m.22719 type:complete len:221 (+) Transcript_11785:538-1200(+)